MDFRSGILSLLALSILAYASVISFPFVHDDVVFILQNPNIHKLWDWSGIFIPVSYPHQEIFGANAYYRPLLEIVYRLEYFFFKQNPAGYHIVNVALHTANAFLVFILTMRMTGWVKFSWAAAILFLLHPVQSESVACISGISNILFAFFVFLSFWQYLKIAEKIERNNFTAAGVHSLLSLGFYGLAILTKEQAIVLAFIFILYEFLFPSAFKSQAGHWRLRLFAFAIVAGGYLIWRKLLFGSFITSFVANTAELSLRLKSTAGIVVNYFKILVFPTDLHYYRSFDILTASSGTWVIVVLLITLCILIGLRLPKGRRELFIFGIGWFAVFLLPTAGLIPIVHEYSFIAAFEHFLYLPLLGFVWCAFAVAGYLVDEYFPKTHMPIKTIIFASAALACIVITVQQNFFWKSEIALFERALRFELGMGRLHLLLGKAYYNNGEFRRARVEFKITEAIMNEYLAKIRDERVRPFYLRFLKEAMVGTAATFDAQGESVSALKIYSQMKKLFPGDSLINSQTVFLAIKTQNWDQAVLNLEEMLKYNPRDPAVLTNLGVCYLQKGNESRAEIYFRRALQLRKDFSPAQANLDRLLEQKQALQTPKL